MRPVSSEDLDILEAWENDPATWAATDFEGGSDGSGGWAGAGFEACAGAGFGACAGAGFGVWSAEERPPYSRAQLAQFIENQRLGIEPNGQLRLVVCLLTAFRPRRIGFVDLFDYDPGARTASVGILIYRTEDRGRGYGTEALRAACEYAFGELAIGELRCTVSAKNLASRAIFEKCGFEFDGKNAVGRKKYQICR